MQDSLDWEISLLLEICCSKSILLINHRAKEKLLPRHPKWNSIWWAMSPRNETPIALKETIDKEICKRKKEILFIISNYTFSAAGKNIKVALSGIFLAQHLHALIIICNPYPKLWSSERRWTKTHRNFSFGKCYLLQVQII